MTEKEFIQLISKVEYEDSTNRNQYYFKVIEAAKQHGAIFDPEPVELPQLKMTQRSSTNDFGYLILTNHDVCPSLAQATEIIRRCNLIPRLRSYISTWFITPTPNDHVQIVLDMIDGKER